MKINDYLISFSFASGKIQGTHSVRFQGTRSMKGSGLSKKTFQEKPEKKKVKIKLLFSSSFSRSSKRI